MSSSILFVDLSSKSGGAERSLRELASGLVPAFDGVITLASAADIPEAFPCRIVPVPGVRLHRPAAGRAFLHSLRSLFAARRALRTIIGDARPDIIVANNIAAVLALPRTKAKKIWYVRDMPRRPYAGFAALRVNRLIAISRAVEERCRVCLPAFLRKRISLVENGIDMSRFAQIPTKADARKTLGIAPDAFVVGMIANLVPWKRHDLFIDIAAATKHLRHPTPQCPSAATGGLKWIIAGDDLYGEHTEYISGLKHKISSLGLDREVEILHGVDAVKLLPALDVLVHPAKDEPFGRVICEAMTCGIPVIASKSGGPAEVIDDGVNGLLVKDARKTKKEEMAVDFAAGILRVKSNSDLRVRLAANARQTIAERFSINRVVRDFTRLLPF